MRYALLLLCSSFRLLAQDADRDGLTDSFEDELLARFAPTFMVVRSDCDALPATFASGEAVPRVVARDGQIYGQVFRAGSFIEVHYYHLWSRDCGRGGHRLDPEHVSVRLAPPDWRAVYWYAAAHESTLCDASQAAPAAALNAADSGATVWISNGKHASFLSADGCRGGCGADRCEQMTALPRGRVVNLGERDAPLHGAIWTSSAAWPLAAKMGSDFPPSMLSQLAAANRIVVVNRPPAPIQSVLAYSYDPIGAAGVGSEHTRSAVASAHESVARSVKTAHQATRRWLQRW